MKNLPGRWLRLIVPALAAALLPGSAAVAQAPSIGFVFPTGGPAGSSQPVTVNGGNLQGAKDVLLSGQGVRATIADASNAAALSLTLEIAADAVPGPREMRVVTPGGTTNAGRVWVGIYPNLLEKEGNNGIVDAQKVESLPVTVQGQVNGAEDVDNFAFTAGANETFVFDLAAFRMASALDGYLALYDARGKILASTLEGFDRDPRLVYTFRQSGAYVIQVRDTLYRGGGNFTYALSMGKLPLVTGYLPMGGRRGSTVTVNLEGVNLGGMTTLPVQLPSESGPMEVVPQAPTGRSISPIVLQSGDLDEIAESEPNDQAAQANSIPSLPIAVSGRIDRPGDVDLFRVRAPAQATYVFEVHGRRIGSRIDSMLRIRDADGKELQSNDDAVGKDSRLSFSMQANTDYLIEVRSIDQRSGGDMYYRLLITPPPAPDFQLTTTPDAVNVGEGSNAVITVNATRLNGFNGRIDLRVEGMPEGVTGGTAFIAQGANSALFTVSAAEGLTPGTLVRPRVIGTAKIGETEVSRVAVGTETWLPPQAPAEQARQRPTRIYTMTIATAPPYTLTLDKYEATVKRGQSVEIKVTAKRKEGQNAAITLAVAGQPANVNPQVTNIAQDAAEGKVVLAVANNAPLVTQNVIITGNLNNNQQPAAALTLTITE